MYCSCVHLRIYTPRRSLFSTFKQPSNILKSLIWKISEDEVIGNESADDGEKKVSVGDKFSLKITRLRINYNLNFNWISRNYNLDLINLLMLSQFFILGCGYPYRASSGKPIRHNYRSLGFSSL